MTNVIGVDIGARGALALLSSTGELLDVADMPILRDGPANRPNVNAPLLANIVRRWQASQAFVEYVGARPKEGPTGAFAFGRSKGVIEGVCAAIELPVAFLTPPVWKRATGIPPGKDGAKDAARSEVIRRWPHKAELFARVKDDGRAEAVLIGLAGLLRERKVAA
jgi:crossover junction endodeoxyribonuclease RuvC